MKLIICGDLSPTEKIMRSFEEKNIQTLFGSIPELFGTADRVVVNLECALTTADSAIQKIGPNIKASPVCAEVLKQIGVTDCGLSNNHIFDYGETGLRDTIRSLEKNRILWTGVGENDVESRKPHIMQIGETKIALLTVCEHEYTYALPDRMGANPYDPYLTMEDIRSAREESDYVIVLYHGGKEHCQYPSPRLRKLCQSMAKNGADVILCQHSHCVGCYEMYENSHILYGQGNFHFVKEHRLDGWYSGLIVVLDIDDTVNISFLPITINEDCTGILLADGKVKERILYEFEERNKVLHTEQWLTEWKMFCESLRGSYLSAISNAYTANSSEHNNQIFAHYLDCEAHTDVWRTICQTWNHADEKN